MRLVLPLAFMLLGCSTPQYTNGSLRCAPTGKACPDQFFCGVDQHCWNLGSGPDMERVVGSRTRDFAVADLASAGAGDLATVGDMATATIADLGHPHDLLHSPDMTMTPLVQLGAVTSGTSTFTASLPSPSRAGTLLVLTVVFDKGGGNSTGPGTGWLGDSGYGGNNTSTPAEGEIWYLAGNAGGITSVTTTFTGATASVGQLSEWMLTNADQSGWCFSNNNTATFAKCPVAWSGWNNTPTPTPQPKTTHAGDVGIAVFAENLATAGTVSDTPSAGWVNLGSNAGTSTHLHYAADFALAIPVSTAFTDTDSSSTAGTWGGAILTFY